MKNKKRISRDEVLGILLRVLVALVLLLFIVCVIKTCVDCRRQQYLTIVKWTGYLPEDEDWDKIPDSIPPFEDDDLDSLPDAVSLEQFFPPIGDQTMYGTCVAWATGYNLKTALNAIDNHWTPEQLADPANQTSPRDLWRGIRLMPLTGTEQPCYGTSFSKACEVLSTQGVSSMADVPYWNNGNPNNCSGTFVGNPENTIASFNHLVNSNGDIPSEKQIKAYLKDTVPLAFAAEVGEVFRYWHSDKVFNLPENGTTGGHAMVLVGYDDSKHAFRIRNSWGTMWGDQGSAWVDYDFFMNGWCKEICIMSNSPKTPPVASPR